MGHTITPSLKASAVPFALFPPALVRVSCKTECLDAEPGPVLTFKEWMWHLPLANSMNTYLPLASICMDTILPSFSSSFHSSSYLPPVGIVHAH